MEAVSIIVFLLMVNMDFPSMLLNTAVIWAVLSPGELSGSELCSFALSEMQLWNANIGDNAIKNNILFIVIRLV